MARPSGWECRDRSDKNTDKSNKKQEIGDFCLVAAEVKRPQQQERLHLYRRPGNEQLLRHQANLVEFCFGIKK